MSVPAAGLGAETKVFLDTNILVYAYDRREPEKRRKALELMEILVEQGLGVISTQVLAEFFVVVTRKMEPPLPVEQAARLVATFTRVWEVVPVTEVIVLEALRGVREHRFSFWDAQIWAAARVHQIPLVFSEDFASGSLVEGVRFVNPFAPDFRMEDWLS